MQIRATVSVNVEDARNSSATNAQLCAVLGATLAHGLRDVLYAAADPSGDERHDDDEHDDDGHGGAADASRARSR